MVLLQDLKRQMVLFMSSKVKQARPPEVAAPPLTTNLDRVARKSASNFNQGYQASQNDGRKVVNLFTAIAIAIIWLILSAMGVGN